MEIDSEASLAGHTVGITADRRWQEQADLFRKRGAQVLHGPTMQTIDLTADARLREVTELTIASPPKVLIVTTGAGMRAWLDVASSWGVADALVGALRSGSTSIICRGAKGVSAVRGVGLEVAWRAEGESMQEVIDHVSRAVPAGDSVTMQLFDPDDHWATAALRERFASLVEVPVYRWLLPPDEGPAEALVWAAVGGLVSAVTFTSQPAVRNLFSIAERLGLAGELRAAFLQRVLAVCVGSVCAEALFECGVTRTVWPDPPRLVPMVKLTETHLSAGSDGDWLLDEY